MTSEQAAKLAGAERPNRRSRVGWLAAVLAVAPVRRGLEPPILIGPPTGLCRFADSRRKAESLC